MEIKLTSDNGIQFLIKEEGLVRRPYLDQVGIPTIGIGCTYYEDGQKVKMSDPPISVDRAISLFKNLLKNYELGVYSVTRDDINQNQFDSMTSLCFNIGVHGFKGSTLVKNVNKNPSDPAIRSNFESWKNAGGKPILLNRRKREANLYFTPVSTITKSPEEIYKEQIRYIQSKLGVTADGVFGPNTKAAVIAFQKTHGLIPDGIVGPQTLSKL